MATYTISGTEITISGVKAKKGKLNVAGYTELYRPSTGQSLGKTSTDAKGYWSFVLPITSVGTDRYEIRFYGSGMVEKMTPDGDWEYIDIVNQSDLPLMLSADATVTVIEQNSTLDVNKAEMAVCDVTLSANVTNGALTWIDIEYKLSTETSYRFLQSPPVALESGEAPFQFTFPLTAKSVNYDLQFTLRGGDGAIGTTSAGSATVVTATHEFNGIADLAELFEVEDLVLLNANNPESGTINSIFASIKWSEMRDIPRGFYPKYLRNGYSGVAVQIYYETAQKFTGYDVFMFVSANGNSPTNNYPTPQSDANGAWYHVGETKTNYLMVRCPATKQIAFWVGAKTQLTSTTSQITKAEYQF